MASQTSPSIGSAVDSVLDFIDKPEDRIVFEIGVAYQYYGAPPNVRYAANYMLLGTQMWESVQYALYKALCNRKKPKEEIDSFLSGNNMRELATALLTILVTQLNVPLSIAIPAAAMILRTGISKFCATTQPKRRLHVKTLLDRKKPRNKNRK